MNLPLRIAYRYLVSRKSHNTTHIISIISMCGVGVATMALLCILSVFNGFQDLTMSLYSHFDAQIKITPTQGKTLNAASDTLLGIAAWPEVAVFSPVLEENAMLVYRDKQIPALIKGVSNNFQQLVQIDSLLRDGVFTASDSLPVRTTIGVGLANTLGVRPHYVHPIEMYAPKRNARVNMANPMMSFNKERIFLSGVFGVDREEYDNRIAIVPISFARQFFNYQNEATSIELKLTDGADEAKVITAIKKRLGDHYSVKNRMQQQEIAYRMTQVEKWVTFLILCFILMIATFNVAGSLSMLILDKRDDIKTLSELGADPKLIARIFLTEGWLISIIGALAGLLLGITLCLLQQHFGFIKLGENVDAFIINAYPVKLIGSDILITLLSVSALSFLAAWYPVQYLTRKGLTSPAE